MDDDWGYPPFVETHVLDTAWLFLRQIISMISQFPSLTRQEIRVFCSSMVWMFDWKARSKSEVYRWCWDGTLAVGFPDGSLYSCFHGGVGKTRCLQARCLHNLDSRLLKSAYFPGETGVSWHLLLLMTFPLKVWWTYRFLLLCRWICGKMVVSWNRAYP